MTQKMIEFEKCPDICITPKHGLGEDGEEEVDHIFVR